MKRYILYILMLYFHFANAQNNILDSLITSLEKATHDTVRCNALSKLAEIAPDGEWERYNEQLYVLAQKNIKNSSESKTLDNLFLKYLATALNNKAVAAQFKDDNASAIKYLQSSVNIQESINDKSGLSASLNNLGILYNSEGNTKKATECFFFSLKLAEETNDQSGVVSACANIAVQYLKENNLKKQLEFLYKALEAGKKTNDISSTAVIYHLIGEYYHLNGDLQKAFENYSICLTLLKGKGNNLALANILHSLGEYYNDKRNFPLAATNFSQSLKIREEINDGRGIVTSYFGFSKLYSAQNNLGKAQEYAEKAMALAQKLAYPPVIADAAKNLKDIYQKQNSHAKALQMFEIYITMRDSIVNQQTRKATIQNQIQYEFDKKQVELKLEQTIRDAKTKAEYTQQKIIIIASFGLAVIALLSMFLILKQRKFRTEQRSIQLEQMLLRSQMNPHFLFNSLNSIQRMFVEGKIDIANDVMSDFSNLLRRILNNSGKEKVSLREELDTLKLYLDLEQIRANNAFTYSFDLDKNINEFDAMVPPLIFQPFVENAIWHGLLPAKKQGKIIIRIRYAEKGDALDCEVIDNGIGFNIENIKKPESKGIYITENRLTTKVKINTKQDHGTTISFTINL